MELTTSEPAPTALHGLNRMSAPRQLGLMIAIAAAVALGVWVALWSRAPGHEVLFGGLNGKESAEVAQALKSAGIAYRIDAETGAITVPAGRIAEAKMKLAADGLPRSSERGLEMLNDDPGFGTSQFTERARYQRALEIELARTVSSLRSVRSARVHLNLPRQSAFVRARKRPSASVLLNMYNGRRLDSAQITAVANLVSAAVENLEPGAVRIIDQQGRLLSLPDGDDPLAVSNRHLAYTRKMENDYIRRIENILAPIVGSAGVKAQVTIETDASRLEQTRESFNPDLPAVRSEQVSEQQRTGDAASGVPGALSNQPPGAGAAPEQAGEAGASTQQGATGSMSKKTTRNYELDRTISHTQVPAGGLRRISAAVLVDDMPVVDAEGNASHRALTPEETARMTALVKEAIGFSAERGDTVNLINSPFTRPEVPEPLPEPPLWEQAWVWDIARQAGGALFVLILVFAVLRPAMRNLVAREVVERQAIESSNRAQLGLDGQPVADGTGQTTGAQAQLDGGDLHALTDDHGQQQKLGVVRGLVNDDPMRVANVMKNWVNEGD